MKRAATYDTYSELYLEEKREILGIGPVRTELPDVSITILPSYIRRRPPPQVLCFQSEWKESGKVIVMHLQYTVATRVFEMDLDSKKKPVSFVVFQKGKNRVLEEFDLHVGRRIEVIGRLATLKGADGKTRKWLDEEAFRLYGFRCKLKKELEKFRFVKDAELFRFEGKTASKMEKTKYQGLGGIVNLTGLIASIRYLMKEITSLRPNFKATLR